MVLTDSKFSTRGIVNSNMKFKAGDQVIITSKDKGKKALLSAYTRLPIGFWLRV